MMEQRINLFEKGQAAIKSMYGIGTYLSKCSIEQPLLNLLYFRVSQINGCAYCLDMHSKDLRAKGESEQRLYMIAAWRESPCYSDRERAALAWVEAVTAVDVPDQVYEATTKHFTEDQVVELTMAAIAINSYNRLNIAFRTVAGGYQPGQKF